MKFILSLCLLVANIYPAAASAEKIILGEFRGDANGSIVFSDKPEQALPCRLSYNFYFAADSFYQAFSFLRCVGFPAFNDKPIRGNIRNGEIFANEGNAAYSSGEKIGSILPDGTYIISVKKIFPKKYYNTRYRALNSACTKFSKEIETAEYALNFFFELRVSPKDNKLLISRTIDKDYADMEFIPLADCPNRSDIVFAKKNIRAQISGETNKY